MTMKINLTPQRRHDRLKLSRTGDALTINGETFNFAALTDGATLPRNAVSCEWLASDVTRTGGAVCLTLILPHGANAPNETRFPPPITITSDGPVILPAYESETPA